ncbi:MAG: hypothetical protein ACFFC7_32840 [Candidatus Hermodarchaeota archaeon]
MKNVIFALSENIRIQILKYLFNTTDADAKTIAKAISKATNTTLYHLNVLNEANIVECNLKPKEGKQVYHWSLKDKEFLLKINVGLLIEHSLDTYILRTLILCKKENIPIGKNLKQSLDLDALSELLGIDRRLTRTILEKMTLERIIDRIYRKIYGDLMDYKKNREVVRIDAIDIQREWNLEERDALTIFYRLLQTGKFNIDSENRIYTL